MPRSQKLTWQPGADGRPGRWRKKYKGKMYYFNGGRGKTDRESYDKALAAWEAQKVRVDQQRPKPHQAEYEQAIGEWEEVLAWCNKHGDAQTAARAEEKLSDLRRRLAGIDLQPLVHEDSLRSTFDLPPAILEGISKALQRAEEFRGIASHKPDGSTAIFPHPGGWLDSGALQEAIWKDRLEVQKRSAVSPEASLQAHIQSYLQQREQQMQAGGLSVGHYYGMKLHLVRFQDFLGKDTPVVEIDGKTMAAYHGNLLAKVASKEWTRTTANNYFRSVRAFVRWLWQIEALPSLPRNLDGKAVSLRDR